MCFEDDPLAEMTQIDLWKSYRGTFVRHSATHPHLIAGDFIKNVSNTFNGASAQVAGGTKYVIRGIKPRRVPVDVNKGELLRCQWKKSPNTPKDPDQEIFAGSDTDECSQWFWNGQAMFTHIIVHHLGIPLKPEETREAEAQRFPSADKNAPALWQYVFPAEYPADSRCHWSSCRHSITAESAKPDLRAKQLARHIHTHMPEKSLQVAKPKSRNVVQLDENGHHWLNTGVDESHRDPCGLPLGAVLCLRNIARGLGRLPNDGDVVEALIKAVPGSDEEDEDSSEDEAEEKPDGEVDTEAEAEVETATEATPAAKPVRTTRKAILVRKVFGNIRNRLFFTLGHNHILRDYVNDVLRSLARSQAC